MNKENENIINGLYLQINDFSESEINQLSPFFKEWIIPRIKFANVSFISNSIKYCLYFDESFDNGFGTLHGGVIAEAINGLSYLTISYFNIESSNKQTLDTSINYIKVLNFNSNIFIQIICNKLGRYY